MTLPSRSTSGRLNIDCDATAVIVGVEQIDDESIEHLRRIQ